MKTKKFFQIFFLLLVAKFIFAEETVIEEPLYWDFFQQQKIIEEPKIDYEDIEVSYPSFVSPEIKKYNDNYKILTTSPTLDITTEYYLGIRNSIKYLYIKKLFPSEMLSTNLNNSIILVEPYNEFVVSKYDLNYTKIFNSGNINFRGDVYSHILNTQVDQYKFGFVTNWVIKTGVGIFYSPKIIYTKEIKNNFDYCLITQGLKLKLFPFHTISTNLMYLPILINSELNNFYGIDFVTKDTFWSGIKISLNLTQSEKQNKYYYTTEFEQKIYNWTIMAKLGNKYYYDYLEDYFVKYPNLKLSRETIIIPELTHNIFQAGYETRNLSCSFGYKNEEYDNYPTYIFTEEKMLSPYYDGTKKISSIFFDSTILTNNYLSLNCNFGYLLNEEDILFYPKIEYKVKINSKIKKFFVSTTFIGKEKVLYNTSPKQFIDNNLIASLETGFYFSDEISINILYNTAVEGKTYLQPEIDSLPYVMLGLKVKF